MAVFLNYFEISVHNLLPCSPQCDLQNILEVERDSLMFRKIAIRYKFKVYKTKHRVGYRNLSNMAEMEDETGYRWETGYEKTWEEIREDKEGKNIDYYSEIDFTPFLT